MPVKPTRFFVLKPSGISRPSAYIRVPAHSRPLCSGLKLRRFGLPLRPRRLKLTPTRRPTPGTTSPFPPCAELWHDAVARPVAPPCLHPRHWRSGLDRPLRGGEVHPPSPASLSIKVKCSSIRSNLPINICIYLAYHYKVFYCSLSASISIRYHYHLYDYLAVAGYSF